MTLIATAKANGIEPHAWLTDVLTRLPTTKDCDIATLLPLGLTSPVSRCRERTLTIIATAQEHCVE